MKTVRAGFIFVVLAMSTSLFAQDQVEVNRTPISDREFAIVSDHFGYDRSANLDTITLGSWPHRIPYTINKVEFKSTHGERVPAYFTHPKDSTGTKYPAVLLLHGMNGFWGKNEDWALDWMDILSREGWCVLVADFYGFGERMQAGQGPAWDRPPYASRQALIQSVTDQRRGLDYLMSRAEVDTSRIALMGGSMGGYFGVFVAGLEDRFATVVLTVTGAWPEDLSTDDQFGRFGHTLNFAPRVNAPILMANATGDGRTLGEELFNAMPNPKKQVWYESDHYLPPREYNEDVVGWLHEHLD
ncbi:MAG: alpha/beta fold hydrolase [Gemmatimonadetes bacterium]|jgi:dienelactone hydrolase|nr:alpha/beta fold hydrolase [Gemmatimonadota bacterium]